MQDLEAKVISAVLNDKQIHVLLQANADSLFKTHKDVWDFVRIYSEQNMSVPPASIVVEKFRDFEPVAGVGGTKPTILMEDSRTFLRPVLHNYKVINQLRL